MLSHKRTSMLEEAMIIVKNTSDKVFDDALIYTPEEYLLRERTSLHKHTFMNGKVQVMAGASLQHNKITTNIFRLLLRQLSDEYSVLGSDMRVYAPDSLSFT
jgi:hypothetical protein